MENNLKEFREMSRLTPKQLSILLNISVYTYLAIEQNKFTLSEELIIMISRIYHIPVDFIFKTTEYDITQIEAELSGFAVLDDEGRFRKAIRNLTGQDVSKSVYRQIRNVKAQICDELYRNSNKEQEEQTE